MIAENRKLFKIRLAMIAVALVGMLVFFALRAKGAQKALAALARTGETHVPTQATQRQMPPDMAGAKEADVKSIDSIMAALYDVISGPAGERDWNRFRSLFIPEGRLMPVRKPPAPGTPAAAAPNAITKPTLAVMTVEDYVNRAGAGFRQNGFFESEVSRKQEQYGHIAQVFSTYESRHAKGEKPFARGINSIELFNDGTRWWIVQISWDAEAPGQELPEKYLTK